MVESRIAIAVIVRSSPSASRSFPSRISRLDLTNSARTAGLVIAALSGNTARAS